MAGGGLATMHLTQLRTRIPVGGMAEEKTMRWLVALVLVVLWAGPGRASDVIVRDGRTLQLGSTTYRLDGIDAPDVDQMCIDEIGRAHV